LLRRSIDELVPTSELGVPGCQTRTLARIVDVLGQVDYEECRIIYDYACLEGNIDDLEDFAFMDQVEDLAAMKRSILGNHWRFHAPNTMIKAMERALWGFVSILFLEESADGQLLVQACDGGSAKMSEYIMLVRKITKKKEYGLMCVWDEKRERRDVLIHFTNLDAVLSNSTSLEILSRLLLPDNLPVGPLPMEEDNAS
jgi:hypothetical protein